MINSVGYPSRVGSERQSERSISTSRWTVVADAIRQGMLDSEYAPGQRLVEDDIVRRYSSSRFLVRRALDQLVAADLVDQLPNRGARVRQLSVTTAIELYRARGALDALVTTEAALRTTPRAARSLAELRSELVCSSDQDDASRFSRARTECAKELGSISGQVEAQRLSEQTTTRLWWYRRHLVTSSRPPRIAVKDTVALVDAVRTRDVTAARDAVASHISAVCAALRAIERRSASSWQTTEAP